MWKNALAIVWLVVWLNPPTKASLIEWIENSDLIVTGHALDGAETLNGLEFRLTVEKVLKGQASPGSILTVRVYRNPDPRLGPWRIRKECRLWYLKQSREEWVVIPRHGRRSFGGLYDPLGDCSSPTTFPVSPDASVTDQVTAYLVEAVEHFKGGRGYAYSLIDILDAGDSQVAKAVFERFSKSDIPGVRLAVISTRLRQQDSSALVEVEQDWKAYAVSPARMMLVSTLSNYTNPDPAGVQVLGKIATSPETTEDDPLYFTQKAAVYALRQIHSAQAMPYLIKLLDHSQQEIREFAVGGISLFYKEVPITRPGSSEQAMAMDDAFNPGKQKGKQRTAEDDHVHFGDSLTRVKMHRSWNSGRAGGNRTRDSSESRPAIREDGPQLDLCRGPGGSSQLFYASVLIPPTRWPSKVLIDSSCLRMWPSSSTPSSMHCLAKPSTGKSTSVPSARVSFWLARSTVTW